MSLMQVHPDPAMKGELALRAVILLAGSSRRPELAAVGRSPLDLPLGDGSRVLDRVLSGVSEVIGASLGDATSDTEVRLLVGHEFARGAQSVPIPEPRAVPWLRVEKDMNPLRGTGGALLDATLDYDENDLVAVLQAGQVNFEPLRDTVAALLQRVSADGSDVVIATSRSGVPDGTMLVRCGALRGLKREGFVDFKEQALPALARDYRVSVVQVDGSGSVPVRTLGGYLQAVSLTSGVLEGSRDPLRDLDPGVGGGFQLIEPGAKVGAGARVVDSVVLAGATVEPGAVVVRSLIGPGVVVRSVAAFVDRLAASESGGAR
jgi:hypothetical protein